MPAYLLTWNPQHSQWTDLADIAQQLRDGIPVEETWSCGNSRSIPIGSQVFMLRQGTKPKGIIASGWVTKASFPDAHWDEARAAEGKQAFFVRFMPDALLDPDVDQPLDVSGVAKGPLSEVQVNAPASGNSIPDHVAIALSKAWAEHLGKDGDSLGRGDPELGAMEGEMKRRFVSHRARERALRDAKIEQVRFESSDGRVRCQVPRCNFDFEAVYGRLAKDFAHVHHLRPLAEAPAPTVTKLEDLAVVCANCHAIIHRGGACHPIETLIPAPGR
jgi:hypothetical protein